MRLDFCVYHAFEREETSSIEQMQEVLEKDTSVPSCSSYLAASHTACPCARLSLSRKIG